jgi:multisubunit Na+/H+ antiporter MnhG subunit
MQARAHRVEERAQAERRRHASVDAVFEMVDRDREVGGGIMAGALAYRLFIWLLPFALVAVGGLGVAAQTATESPESAAKSLGLAGLVSSSVASAANSPAHWYALLIGFPILLWATRSLLRALIVVHRLVWADLRAAAPKPTVGASVQLLAVLVGFVFVSALASSARSWSVIGGILVTLAVTLGQVDWSTRFEQARDLRRDRARRRDPPRSLLHHQTRRRNRRRERNALGTTQLERGIEPLAKSQKRKRASHHAARRANREQRNHCCGTTSIE